MTPSFREILEVLNQHQIDYIVVGGVAAVIQGPPIATFDLDALVRVDPANSGRLQKKVLSRPKDRAVAQLLEQVLRSRDRNRQT